MASTIVVMPERLRHAALAVRALGRRLAEVRGGLGATVAGLDAAFGAGEARAAFATLWTRWSGSAERLAAAVDHLAFTLEAAADDYERADRKAILAPGAAPPPPVLAPGTAAPPPSPARAPSTAGSAGGGGVDATGR